MSTAIVALICAVAAYLVGSIPSAYVIVRLVTGEDITAHGTGNVGAMNVRRTTGSWAWFGLAMIADFAKGFVPVVAAKALVLGPASVGTPTTLFMADDLGGVVVVWAAVLGVVLGHNYSIWMAWIKGRFARTGKGLAVGAGALLAYDWRYFLVVVVVGLLVIAVTRYMMAGQVAAAVCLPLAALAFRSADWPFMALMGLLVYAAHHRRFVGLLRGQEPRLYVHDGTGPRG